MIDYVFWFTEDNSERTALHYSERINKKFGKYRFFSVPCKINEDFALIDYKEGIYEKIVELRGRLCAEVYCGKTGKDTPVVLSTKLEADIEISSYKRQFIGVGDNGKLGGYGEIEDEISKRETIFERTRRLVRASTHP